MMKTKVKYLLASVVVASSMVTPMGVLAEENNTNTTGVIADSVVIDKSETSKGDTTLVPEKELDVVPEDGLGSIVIKLPDTEKKLPKDGVKFSVTKIADIVNGEYVIDEALKDTDVDLNNIKNANELELAASKLEKVVKSGDIIITDAQGTCIKVGMEVGVYLVYATDINNYENITPFIVSIPTWDEAREVMTYDIEILPKHSPLPETPKRTPPSTATENKSLQFALGSLTCIALAGGLYLVTKKKKSVQ